jgi:hypothetical protein
VKSRGVLQDTIAYWTTEFGRMACNQGSKRRDHNPFAFTTWLAVRGFKGGISYGADHEPLTFRYNGSDRRLTDVHGNVIRELI